MADHTFQEVLADDDIPLEAISRTAAFGKSAEADLITARFDEIANEIAAYHPSTGSDKVDWRHGTGSVPDYRVSQNIRFNEPVVRHDSIDAINLEVCIEVSDCVIPGNEMTAPPDHMKCVFASVLAGTDTTNGQIFKRPVRRRNKKSFDHLVFEDNRTGLLGP